jgi:hypothetical protein
VTRQKYCPDWSHDASGRGFADQSSRRQAERAFKKGPRPDWPGSRQGWGTCSALRGNLVTALSSDRHSVRRHIFCSEAISEHGPHGVEVHIVDSSLSVCQGVAPNADKGSSRGTGIEGGESLGRSLNEAPSFPLEMRIAILGRYTPRPKSQSLELSSSGLVKCNLWPWFFDS